MALMAPMLVHRLMNEGSPLFQTNQPKNKRTRSSTLYRGSVSETSIAIQKKKKAHQASAASATLSQEEYNAEETPEACTYNDLVGKERKDVHTH